MKQEDKEFLIKDLCARLPYGVKALFIYPHTEIQVKILGINETSDGSMMCEGYDLSSYYKKSNLITNIKSYLFPMSSITEEHRKEYLHLLFEAKVNIKSIASLIDWLNEHHFDYRGLIDKGLAIDATNLNIY